MQSKTSTMKTDKDKQDQRPSVSSIEARRILAVLDDCKSRVEYAVLLPGLADFLEGRDNIDEEIQAAYEEFIGHQNALSSVMKADGTPKSARDEDYKEERGFYKDSARDLIRVMRKHSDFFAPLLAQSGSSGGPAVKLCTMMKELNDMMYLTFSTPVESDNKQKRVIQEFQERKKSNRECIEHLKARDAAIAKEKEERIKAKEDLLEEIKQQLAQVKATEAALQQEDPVTEEVQEQEESLKAQLVETRAEVQKTQMKDSEEEGKQRRTLRKEEEALQNLIQLYDKDMETLTAQNAEAYVLAEKLEREYSELQAEAAAIEKTRAPIRQEEQGFVDKTLQDSKHNQDCLAAATKLQIEIRKYLKTAPRASKKKKGKKSGRK